MAVSEAQYADWLQRPGELRVVLAELEHSAGTEYVSNFPYVSRLPDGTPDRIYDDYLTGDLEISGRIDSHVEMGVLELVDDGSITHWSEYLWAGYSVTLRLGGPDWDFDDFVVIARQTNAGLVGARAGSIQLGIVDPAVVLSRDIERPVMPDGSLEPLVLGRVIGVPAVRISDAELRYKVSWLPVLSITVRDGNGPVMSHTGDYANGEFVADVFSTRSLMCDVVQSPQYDNLDAILGWVADYYGLQLASGIDLPDRTLGLYYPGAVTGAQILDDLCRSINAHWRINLLGELDVKVFKQPDFPSYVSLDRHDIELGGMILSEVVEPISSLRLGYSRNHSPITEVAGSMSESDAARLRSDWLYVSGDNAVADYPLAASERIDTCLQNELQASWELGYRLDLRSKRHDIYQISVVRPGISDPWGRVVSVNHPRAPSALGVVVSARLMPLSDRAELEVWFG